MAVYYCPELDYFCPYFSLSTSQCKLVKEEGCSPIEECDAFAYLTKEEIKSYIVEEEIRNRLVEE